MKNYLKFTLLFALITNFAFGQNMDYENQVVREHKQKIRSQTPQAKIAGNISGVCDVITTLTNQESGNDWDDCEGLTYEGIIEFQSVDGERYNIFSESPYGEMLNDLSFGGFYECYGTISQNGLPNGDAANPSLYFNVDDSGQFSFLGESQWGEIFSLFDVIMDGPMLTFNWTNDFGEGALVQLERQDGESWEELLIPCHICSLSDSLALVALYNSTGGPGWHITWDLNNPVETWYGVKLNGDCCVSEINMGSSNQLAQIYESDNNLTGSIPDEINDLTGLTSLILRNNAIQGTVLQKLTNLVNLEYLDISGNAFEGFMPAEFGNLTNLTFLDLGFNLFEGEIPDEFENLTNLTFLDFGNNFFTGEIVPKIINSTNLVTVILSGNSFEGTIISEIENLQNLDFITFSNNNFEGEIPASLSNIPNLRIFYASLNNLEGEIPNEVGLITNLVQFSAWGNQFSGNIPTEFGSLSNLINLNLDRNNLTGQIPTAFSLLENLQRLGLAFNQIEGTIPFGIVTPFRVRLNDNNLEGFIPYDFSSLFTPSEINLTNNNFTGKIPNRFFSDSPNQIMYFANNDFSGCIDSITHLCEKTFNEEIDSFSFGTTTYYTFFETGYNFEGNPRMAWEGAIQNACEGQDQIGAPCDDGDPSTNNSGIDSNCECAPVLSTEEIAGINEFYISPNPLLYGSAINVNINVEKGFEAQFYLLDINGKVVLENTQIITDGLNNITLESNGINRGFYLLKMASEDKVISRKVIIQ